MFRISVILWRELAVGNNRDRAIGMNSILPKSMRLLIFLRLGPYVYLFLLRPAKVRRRSTILNCSKKLNTILFDIFIVFLWIFLF
jgi:hypothetical protein